MDSSSINHVSLCSGYGGIDLGLRRCIPNLRTVAYAEIEAFACELLLARMEGGQLDAAPIWTDLKSFPWGKFSGLVDILSGGYPCQPFSSAGKRLGADDPRHLWPFIADGVSRMQPRVVFFENVEGHISLGLREVIADLESRGYKATWGLFSAAECGAPHQRKRVFILAHANSQRGARSRNILGEIGARGQRGPDPSQDSELFAQRLADANGCGRVQNRITSELRPVGFEQSSRDCGPSDPRQAEQIWPARPSQPQFAWEPPRVVRQTQPALGGNSDGIADRMDDAELYVTCDNRIDELRLLGNGVVPSTAELAFRTLSQELNP